MLSAPVVVLDFETTGLSPGVDRITEVAALRVSGRRVVERYVTLVNAGVPVPRSAELFNGISTETVADAPLARSVMRQLLDFIGNDIIVAHHAVFERAVLSFECRHAGLADHSFNMLCTKMLARRLVPGLSNYKLQTVAGHVGARFSGSPHRAEPDAQVTAEVLVALTQKVIDGYSANAVDPQLLRRVTSWSVGDVSSKLRRALGQPAAVRARTINSTVGDNSLLKANRETRWRMYPVGNVRDESTGRLYRCAEIQYSPRPVPTVVLKDPVHGEIRVPTCEIRGFSVDRLQRHRRDGGGAETSAWPDRFPAPVPWTSQPAPSPAGSAQSPSTTATAHWHSDAGAAHTLHRWWLDRDGDLHDMDQGCLYLKSRGAVTVVSHPQPGVIVSDPTAGETFISGDMIRGFAAATRFVPSVERHSSFSVPRSTGQHRQDPKPWVLDLETNTLRHRATGRAFRSDEFTRVTGAVSGYTTGDPHHPWAGDLEIDLEWGA
jgi:DNA polymerase-3 subunit epsilon